MATFITFLIYILPTIFVLWLAIRLVQAHENIARSIEQIEQTLAKEPRDST